MAAISHGWLALAIVVYLGLVGFFWAFLYGVGEAERREPGG